MKRKNNEIDKVKIPKLSPESVTFALVIMSCFQESSQVFMQIVQSLLMFQDPIDSVKELEGTIKKQILPAVQMTCILPLAEKLLMEEHSARAAIAFIYIMARLICQKMGMTEMKPAEYGELWKKIWQIGRMFPIVERGWELAEETNDLRGWQEDMQENAKDKWKYFINKQFPLANKRIDHLNEKMQAYLTFSPTD